MTTSVSVGHPEHLHVAGPSRSDATAARVARARLEDDLKQIGWAGLAHGALIAILGGVLAHARQHAPVPDGRGHHGISARRSGDDHRIVRARRRRAKRASRWVSISRCRR